jgi:CDP-diacylglycerol--glycerol-3-phosphate 3-phosphatidyltransferase
MHKSSYKIVNGISLYRLAISPVLFLLIFTHRPDIFKWFLAISFFTDSIDGYLARRYKVTSILGARVDSIADDLTVAAGILAMIIFKPVFFREQIPLLILLLALFLSQTIVALIRYGKMSSFHTYLAKIAAVLQAIFLCSLLFFKKPVYLLFYITIVLTAIDLLEEIILVFVLRDWKTDVKGLYWVLRKKQELS